MNFWAAGNDEKKVITVLVKGVFHFRGQWQILLVALLLAGCY
jgi:hypothetical protein